MRRRRQDRQPTSMFRAAELRWLFSASLLLVLLYVLISRWSGSQPREAGAGRAATADAAATSSTRPDAASARHDAASDEDRPTDLDPDEAETAKEEFQAISDGTLKLGGEEMEAYYRLVTWVESQSFAELEHRAVKGLSFAELHDHPGRHRGQLAALDIDVVRAQDLGADNRFKVPLYEVSGVTAESRPCYNLVVVDYPKGMPSGPIIRERARFVGYFLKLQGYVPHDGRPDQRAKKRIPLLIGRLRWEPLIVPRPDQTLEWVLGACLLAGVGLFLIGRRVWRSRTARQKRLGAAAVTILAVHPASQANPVDNWLQHVEQGEPEDVPDEPRP